MSDKVSWLERAWYQPKPPLTVYFLAPLALLFYLLSSLRRWAFKLGIKSSVKVSVPVIVVGNISVGGNGKTPLVIRLAQWLRQAGYQPGVLSRGFGGKGIEYPHSVEADADPAEVGDEPVLMRQYLPCPLVVDPKRSRGAQYLIDQHKCDVIICDDGMQHYALARDIEIMVLDGQRRHGNGYLLPMGPLREGLWRTQTVDYTIVNGGQAQPGEHLMTLESGHLVNVKHHNVSKSVSDLKHKPTAIAGIGNPERFFNLLESKGVRLKAKQVFADHHPFTAEDIPQELVIMTEKDAVKCRDFAHDDWWYLPVTAKLSEDLKQQILQQLQQHK